MRRGVGVLAVVLALALAIPVLAGAETDLAQADRAFEAGDHAAALTGYERVLEQDASNPHALLRSGMLLSWERRYDEALERYDRLLAREPDNERASLERAKVLSWDRRYEEAAAAFAVLLERDPGNIDARLGRARTLSWSGRQEPARAEYLAVLDEQPDSAEAMVGIAQTWAWSGRPEQARPWYERALRTRPDMREARLGLAYLDLWHGGRAAATESVRRLRADYPDDGEVAELAEAYRKAGAPWVRGTYDRIEDTDDNDLNIWRAEGGWWPLGRADLRVGWALWDMRAPGRSAEVQQLWAVLGWRPIADHLFSFRLGNDRRELTVGDSDNETVGGVTWTWDALPAWDVIAAVQHDTFKYSTDILDGPGNTIDTYEAKTEGRVGERWRVTGAIGGWDISDGNSRLTLDAGTAYGFEVGRIRMEAGYDFRFMDYDRDLDSGYFDPQDFTAHLLHARGRGRFAADRAYWDALLMTGVQSFTLGGIDVSNDRVFGVQGLVGTRIAESFDLELYARVTDYAQQTATGFESREFGLRLRWQR